MTQREIIEFAEERGAYVALKSFDGPGEPETISIFAEALPVDPRTGIQGWRHGIFLKPIDDRWVIYFLQFGETKLLESMELRDIIERWLQKPSHEIFKGYEAT